MKAPVKSVASFFEIPNCNESFQKLTPAKSDAN